MSTDHSASWPVVTIGELSTKVTVGFVGSMSDLFVEAGVPLLRGQNVEPYRLSLDNLKYISPKTHEAWKKSSLIAGDVVIVRVGYPGTASVIPAGLGPLNAASLVIVRPDPNRLDPHYLAYLLNSPWGKALIAGRLVGSAQQVFNTKTAADFKIPAPPIELQGRIAGILHAYDDLIEVNRRRVALLEEMALALFEEWFVRFRFPGHEGVAVLDTPEGRVPEGWTLSPLTEAVEVSYGFPFKSKAFSTEPAGCRVVRIRDVFEGRTSTWTTEPVDPRYGVVDGDLLVGMDGIFHTAIWAGGPAALNQRVARLRPRDGRSQRWALLSALPHIKFYEATISGTTVAHLGAKHLNKIRVVVASKPIQAAADRFLGSIDDQLLAVRLTNERLAASRDLLLPRLISGQLSVAEAERELAQAA